MERISTLEDEDKAERLHKLVKEDKKRLGTWRANAKECYAFYASEQWSDEDKAILEEQGRPPVSFNRIVRTLNTVSGLEVQNRQEIRYIPREQSDGGVNEVLSAAAKWVRDQCDAEDEESESFLDMLISGMGWTETRLDYELDPDGMIIEERVDPLEMGWDYQAKRKNLGDSQRFWRVREYTKKELKEEWGDKADSITTSEFWNLDSLEPHNADEAWKYENDQSDNGDSDTVPVVQIQWIEKEDYYRVISENGKVIELSTAKFDKLKSYIEQSSLRYVKQKRRHYYQAFIAGGVILDFGDAPCQYEFSFKPITGLRDRNKNSWFGLVSLMLDPQRWANKWLSQIMYIINTNAKGGLLAEKDAFENPRKAEDEWAQSDSITWLNPGGMGKVQEKGQAQYPEGVDRLMQYAIQSVNDVPGVSNELMGLSDRFQPGYVEASRKQAGIALLAPFFDSLRRFRKEQGRLLAQLIKEYISDGRLIRVVGDTGAQYIPLIKDQMTYKYDVVVDDAPTSPNMKERVFGILQEIMPMFIQSGVPVPPEVLDFAPLPETLINKWKAMIIPSPEQQQAQQAQQQKQQQIQDMFIEQQMRKNEADIENKQTSSALNYAKAEHESAIAEQDILDALQKQGYDQMGAQIKLDEFQMEQYRKFLEFQNEQARKDATTMANIAGKTMQ